MWFVEQPATPTLDTPGVVRLEDGTDLGRTIRLPPDLPIGYHEVTTDDASAPMHALVVTPRRCPAVRRAWGWAVQLYAVRSERSWGIGDLGDLRELARWSASTGAGVVLTNPLHADVPVAPARTQPVLRVSRVWRNINLLSVPDLPGASRRGDVLEPLARKGRALNATALLDRDAVLAVKRPALEALFADFVANGGDPRSAIGKARPKLQELHRFAVFSALADVHGHNSTSGHLRCATRVTLRSPPSPGSTPNRCSSTSGASGTSIGNSPTPPGRVSG